MQRATFGLGGSVVAVVGAVVLGSGPSWPTLCFAGGPPILSGDIIGGPGWEKGIPIGYSKAAIGGLFFKWISVLN